MNIRRNAVGSGISIVTSQLDWLKPEDAWEVVGLRKRTFQELRTSGQFIKGIHYQSLNGRTLRYNKQALQHWLATRHNPQLHEEWCRDYLAQLHRGGER